MRAKRSVVNDVKGLQAARGRSSLANQGLRSEASGLLLSSLLACKVRFRYSDLPPTLPSETSIEISEGVGSLEAASG